MAIANRAPDWDWWRHVPTVALHEAVALSLNIDPKQLRRASTRALLAGRQFDEGPEFERRLALAKRCLGDTLPGPVNQLAVRYYDEAAAVRLRDFAAWADPVEWQIPPELARLAPAGGEQSGNAPDPEPNERLTLPEQFRLLARIMPEERARARIEKAFRLKEIIYQPNFAFYYHDARIDWTTGLVLLSRGSRKPFMPTLTTGEFVRHFMPSGLGATETSRAGPQSREKSTADVSEAQAVATGRTVASHASGTRTTTDQKVEVACGEWIAALTKRPRNKETAFREAKAAVAHIGALSYKAFDRAWANRAPDDWKKPGRPKKRPIV